MDYRLELLTLMERFRHARGLSEARIANLASRDSRFFIRLRGGGSCSVDTLIKTRRWFADNWPADAEWPAGIERPSSLELAQ